MLAVLWLALCVQAGSLNIKLQANLTNPPFQLQLLEAIAAQDESLYLPSLRSLYGGSDDNSDWDDEETEFDAEEGLPYSDERAYTLLAPKNRVQGDFFNLDLVNKIHTPRIQAHYAHYLGLDSAKLEKQCSKDNFGQKIENPHEAWVKYGNDIYCSDQDLFALKTSKDSEVVMGFDRVIGTNPDAPLLVFYASPTSERFGPMLDILNNFAAHGTFRFVWRYVPLGSDDLTLPGYGATLTAKSKLKVDVKAQNEKNTTRLLETIRHGDGPLLEVQEDSIPEISLKIAALVMQEEKSRRYALLKDILHNLPLYSPYLLKTKPKNLEQVRKSAVLNENKGASSEAIGMYLNGASIHNLELDLPFVIQKLEKEVRLVQEMIDYGFDTTQTKLLFSKFALLSAHKESQFKTGTTVNRFSLFKDAYVPGDKTSGGVVFFNNLETDDSYQLYSTDRMETYNGPTALQLRVGQIPPLKENVHDLIFAINFSSKQQLRVFFTISKVLLDRAIPQQIGVLPLIGNEKDALLADMFYHIMEVGESTEALALLYKYWDSKDEEAEEKLLKSVDISEENLGNEQYKETLKKYSIDVPSVIFNGVIHDMKSSNWQTAMGNQIAHDVRLLQQLIGQGEVEGKSLKSLLYAHAKSFRNTRVIPKDLSNIRYKKISPEMIESSFSFKKVVDTNDISSTFWLIGDFNSELILGQFRVLMDFIDSYKLKSVQVRVINTSDNYKLLDSLHEKYSVLTSANIKKLIEQIKDTKETRFEPNAKVIELLQRNHIQLHHPIMLLNSRYFGLNLLFAQADLELLLDFEYSQRLGIFKEITDAYPDPFHWKPTMHFKRGIFNHLDWFDLVSSTVSNSYFLEDSMLSTDVSRFDFSKLNSDNTISFSDYDLSKLVDVFLMVDPVDERSQKLISIVNSIADLSFVNVQIMVQPLASEKHFNLNVFYADTFIGLKPTFDDQGKVLENHEAIFEVPSGVDFAADVDVPSRWLTVKGPVTNNIDLEGFSLSKSEEINTSFILSKLVVEAFVKNVNDAQPIAALVLEATQGYAHAEGTAMQTLGYLQLQLDPGVWDLQLKRGSTSEQHYELLSASSNRYDANDLVLKSTPLSVLSLHGSTIQPRLRPKAATEEQSDSLRKEGAAINVFSIASGKIYERFIAAMMTSVAANTKHELKFWLVDTFMTAEFREQLPKLAKQNQFLYELVSYKWPLWLRQQKIKHREVWGYKVLFLDVLFPSDLEKVVFVDADQIARTDLIELVETDLLGAPYGFPPMCESRKETEGLRFWKQGYWQNVLKDDLKYHISALFVVDRKRFRQLLVGDRMRSHYQKLSSDPNSLANLDQDLPNNMQRLIPIHTLDQDWLWCETWCSEKSKANAKMIDLCNNPLSSESKLERARRLIPEWDSYDQEARKIIVHDEL